MKKYCSPLVAATLARMGSASRNVWSRFLTRRELRSTVLALVLAAFAPLASAVSLDDLGSATDAICLISAYVSGPWLFVIGCVVIILAAVAIGSSESTIVKVISTAFVGIGIAACAVPIMKNHFHINYTCA